MESAPQAVDCPEKPISKNSQKKLLKQQRYEAKKAEKKAMLKEQKRRERERKKREWQEKLELAGSEEERQKLIESRRELRKERMEQRCGEKESKLERLNNAKLNGQKIVIDLEFAHLMNSTQLHNLVQQVNLSPMLVLYILRVRKLSLIEKWCRIKRYNLYS